MNELKFIPTRYRASSLLPLQKQAIQTVRDRAGVYVLLTAGGIKFLYPRGRSAVFYIGQASGLRKRLIQHLKYTRDARGSRPLDRYWPRYEYAAAFGARFAIVPCSRGRSPRSLEGLIIRPFAAKFRAQPVANAQGSWGR